MRFLFPFDPLNEREADGPYKHEYVRLKELGANCSLFDFDSLDFEFRPRPRFAPEESVLYRGWMLSPVKYEKLVTEIEKKGGAAITSFADYVKCHHLPGWYELCRDLTPETVFLSNDGTLKGEIESLQWDKYFIKDFVKSNNDERGSIASDADEALEIIGLIEKFRGEIEGGISVRRVESFVSDSERRYFVFNGKPYAPNSEIPDIVHLIASLIICPFYSIDTILRDDGVTRLVEIGDGQVSDKKSWPIEPFVEMLIENAI